MKLFVLEMDPCHVCLKTVGKAHKCIKCDKFIHAFCGDVEGEEGYGKDIICFTCKDGKLNISSVHV